MSETRTARCAYYGSTPRGRSHEGYCNRGEPCLCERPSSGSLPFLERRGPGDTDHECRNCPYNLQAHQPPTRDRPHLRGRICGEFAPRTEGHEFDRFYCGCWGWD